MDSKALDTGSSPLTRGKRGGANTMSFQERLIPAHAGKTCSVVAACMSGAGSSPLTRGKRSCHVRYDKRCGLIPAHAGKTSPRSRRRVRSRAHPRSRGENFFGGDFLVVCHGSSPLTRGKLPGPCYRPAGGRLIPAHAGKTNSRICSESAPAAHPRSRGENNAAGHDGAD